MPELPEVEIVRQSLEKKIKQRKIKKVIINNRSLRFRIPLNFEKFLLNKIIKKVTRFSKYLILNFTDYTFCIIHLGMSGTIHLIKKNNFSKTEVGVRPEFISFSNDGIPVKVLSVSNTGRHKIVDTESESGKIKMIAKSNEDIPSGSAFLKFKKEYT